MANYTVSRSEISVLGRLFAKLKDGPANSLKRLHYAFNDRRSQFSASSLRLIQSAKSKNGLTVYVVVRDERHQLPQFLDHYRKLGFGHFCVVDNASSDGAIEFLSQQPDVTIYQTQGSFRRARGGALWRNSLIKKGGLNRWVCIVDADEYLVFPSRFGNAVQSVIDEMERVGQTRLLAPMVDLYRIDNSDNEYFDASPEIIRVERRGIAVWGGVRMRLSRQNNPNENGPILSKYPLIYFDAETFFNEPHFPHPHDRNRLKIGGRLLHRKMTTWSHDRINEAVAHGQYWNGSLEYKKYRRWIDEELSCECTKLYTGPDDLMAAGLMGEGPASLKD